jgi:hypothetical protein
MSAMAGDLPAILADDELLASRKLLRQIRG